MGHTWLHKHNPEIDWITGEVEMSRCDRRCCSGCQDEIRKERKIQKLEARRITVCSEGDLPALVRDDEDDEDEANLADGDVDLNLLAGEHLFVAGLQAPPEEIRATSTISQLVFEGPVWSGFLAKNGLTVTVTG